MNGSLEINSRGVFLGHTQGRSPEPTVLKRPFFRVNFYGRDFFVNSDVLMPRAETEQMVDAALNLAGVAYLPGVKPGKRRLPERPVILDVGTGSGCVAVTLAKELPGATIVASDVSEAALSVAQKNAARFEAQINFEKSYLLKEIKLKPDVIVANLPYVDPEWDWIDKKALAEEPAIALYAEDHGLKLIKELIDTANSEYLILEADPCQHEEIIAYAKKKKYGLMESRGYILSFNKINFSRFTHVK